MLNTAMSTNYTFPDTTYGTIDLEDKYITDAWMIEQFVGGVLYSWGSNAGGVLGNNSATGNVSSPVQIGTLSNWKQTSVGQTGVYPHTAFLKTDGTIWTCGYDSQGQLGNNASGVGLSYSSPIQIGNLTSWRTINAGQRSVGAIRDDGTLWMWGQGTLGQLGNGVVQNKSSPTQVGSLTNWKDVVCSYFTIAVKTDGTAWTWGYNNYGQMGNGVTNAYGTFYSSPNQVGSLTDWRSVRCGYGNAIAIKTNGTLWTWGYGYAGVLGNNTALNYSSPIQVGSLTDWKQVISATSSVAAIKNDGSLWTWGANGSGQLGNGTTVDYSSPIQIGALTNWKMVNSTLSASSFIAIKTDGTLWSWGQNNNGQLGNGTTTNYSSPIQIGSGTAWKYATINSYLGRAITFRDTDY